MKIKTPEYIELATNSIFSMKQENEYSTLVINSDADLQVYQFDCYSIQSSDYINCGGSFTCNGSLKSGSAEVTSLKVKQAGNGVTLSNFSSSLVSDGNIIPNTTGACDLGGSNFRWNNVYSLNVDAQQIDIIHSIVPTSNNTASIGQSYQRFNNAYINHIETTDITIPYGSDSFVIKVENGQFSVNTGIYPTGSFDLGTVSNMWRTLYALEIDLDPTNTVKLYEDDGDLILQPKVNGAVYIGTSTNTHGDLYAKKLHGCLETLYDPNFSVGSLAEIQVANITDSAPVTLTRAYLVQNGEITELNKRISVTVDGVAANGKWRILNSVTFTGTPAKVMAVRVE